MRVPPAGVPAEAGDTQYDKGIPRRRPRPLLAPNFAIQHHAPALRLRQFDLIKKVVGYCYSLTRLDHSTIAATV